jgi:diguanylate cyclase (GGDEF)-like protein
MSLDPWTVALVSGLIVTLCGVTFILNTTLRRNDAAGRLWSVAFTAGILQTLAYTIWAIQPAGVWALAVGNAMFVVALGLLWSGLRVANDRQGLLWIPLIVGAIVALAVVVRGPDGGDWAGAVEMFIAVAALSGVAAFESVRGRMRRNLNARTLTVAFAVIGIFYLGRTIALLVLGPTDPTFLLYFGPIPATLMTLALVILGTISLSIIQTERFGSIGRTDAASETGQIDGIAGPQLFRELAESWLLRSVRERTTLVLILFDLANLEEINVAFGRAAGDRAVRLVGRVAATQSPAAALVGHLDADRFAVLLPLPSGEDVAAVGDRISAGILNSPLDDADRFRASAFVGIASTRTAGSRYDGLLEAADEAVRDAAAVIPLGAVDGSSTVSRWQS